MPLPDLSRVGNTMEGAGDVTATGTQPHPSKAGSSFDLVHRYCCDPNRAWCGADITSHPICAASRDEDECALCRLAEAQYMACACQTEVA